MNKVYAAVCLSALALVGCGGGGGSDSNPPKSSARSSSISSVASSAPVSSVSSESTLSSSSVQSSSLSSSSLAGIILGADLSWVTELEAAGKKFYNDAGIETEAFQLMSDLGMNAARFRVWVNPANGYNSVVDVVAKAKRAKEKGQRIMIDFHYSDSWADPGKQTKPAEWASMSMAELKIALATHTNEVLTALKNEGIEPEWVQVGNETNDGMLWNDARPSMAPESTTMKNYADLTSAGYNAVKVVFPDAKVIVHLANCHDSAGFRWIFDGLRGFGGKFDVIGASAYPTHETSWSAATAACLANMNDLVDRYDVPVMLTEVGVPWDHVEAKAIMADLIAKTAAVNDGQGLGVFYWEPLATPGWNGGYTMGATNNQGRPTAAMEAFTEAAAAR